MTSEFALTFAMNHRQELERLASVNREKIRALPAESMQWLAIAPAWTIELAQAANFPVNGDVEAFFELATDEGVCTKSEVLPDLLIDPDSGRIELGAPEVLYSVPLATARQIMDSMRDATVPMSLSKTVAEIGQALLNATSKNAGLHPTIRAWAQIASRAESDPSSFLLKSVEANLSELDFAGAARWIEAATPLESLMKGRLSEAILLASLRYQLRQHQQDASKQLDRFVERAEQTAAFEQLLDGSSAQWALHYAGVGGMGKTMLMRYLQAHAIPARDATAAHVDFDYLNPEYPSTKPALLLLQLSEELRLNDRKGVASGYFESFGQKAVTFHEGLTAGARPASPVQLIRDVEFQLLLDTFASAAQNLPQPVVLILDTCEELAKMLSNGSVPDNVTATFEVLEGLHQRLPQLRVIFSGRRPLASEGAGGWKAISTSVAGGVPRDYLRVHEVRGFTRANAEEFLKKKSHCPEHLVDAVLERCPERAHTRQFDWLGVRIQDQPVARFSPFELALYASWIAADPSLTADLIRSSNFDQYIRTRIIGRLHGSAIHKLLPAIAWLGRFDDASLLTLANLPAESSDGRALLDEILRQEWIERQPGRFAEIERGLRPLLFDYYKTSDPALLEKCREASANYLQQRTESAPLSELDLSHFEALLRLLDAEPERAAGWWERIEARVLESDGYSFILPITRRLLASELWPSHALQSGKRISAAIAATQAAAQLHTGSAHDLPGTWKMVQAEAKRHPIAETAKRLNVLALAWSREFGSIDSSELNEQTVAALVQSIGLELDSGDGLKSGPSSLIESIADLTSAMVVAPVSTELRASTMLLRGRALAQSGRHVGASRDYCDAFATTSEFARTKPRWLHWVGPDDLACSIKLEFVRRTYPNVFSPRQLISMLNIPFPNTIDADRLGSAVLSVQAAQAPVDLTLLAREREHSAANAIVFAATSDSHYRVPPFFIAAAEEEGLAGNIPKSLGLLQTSTQTFESSAGSYVGVVGADRACARILHRFRLLEEGMFVPDSVTYSDDPEDVHVRLMLAALAPGDAGASGGAALGTAMDARAAHFLWRASAAVDSLVALSTLTSALEVLRGFADSNSFLGLSCCLDIAEIVEMVGGRHMLPDVPAKANVGKWWRANGYQPVEALTLWLRSMALYGTRSPPRRLVKQVGPRRSASIAVEEGELLSLRLPVRALKLFRFASSHYRGCRDPMGAMFADAGQALACARLADFRGLKGPLRRVRNAFHGNSGDFLAAGHWPRIEGIVEGTQSDWQEASSVWLRPWSLRIAACLAYQRDGADSLDRRARVAKVWRRFVVQLPPEVRGWLDVEFPASRKARGSPVQLAVPASETTVQVPGRRSIFRLTSQRSRSSGSLFESSTIFIESPNGAAEELPAPSPKLPYADWADKLSHHFAFDLGASITLAVDRGSAWICWEAIFDRADNEGVVRRVCVSPQRRQFPRAAALSQMFTLTMDHSGADLAGSASKGIEWTYAYEPGRLMQSLPTGPSGQILHIIGDPLETRAGLRIQVGDADSSNVKRGERARLISADEASRLLPNAQLAILQCPTMRRSARSGVDREKAAYLRSFAAELNAEIPTVVTIPALDFDAGVAVLRCFTREADQSVELSEHVEQRVREARNTLIGATDSINKEERLDISFYGDMP